MSGEVNLNTFKASHMVIQFQKIHEIVSRKIMKFITRNHVTSKNDLNEIGLRFVMCV